MQCDHPFDHACCPFSDGVTTDSLMRKTGREELEQPGGMKMWLKAASGGAGLGMEDVDV